MNPEKYKQVRYRWDTAVAAKMESDPVNSLVYRSNLLGADLQLTNYGGGNTSCKVRLNDPVSGDPVEVLYVKGSGGDLGTMQRSGLSALYLDRLRALRKVYRGLEYEDEMVERFSLCLFDPASRPPSIDTPLHAFLPFAHIDHLHPDAAIAVAAAKQGEAITHDLFGGTLGWVPWQRPGFDLGLRMLECLDAAARKGNELRGIMLGGHGLFSWGDTSMSCYTNTLDIIETCASYIESEAGKKGTCFGGAALPPSTAEVRSGVVGGIAPVLRGHCSSDNRMVGHFTDDPDVLEFVNSRDLHRLAAMGTSCPDHFLRTKIAPLVLDPERVSEASYVSQCFQQYREAYAAYYEAHKDQHTPAMRDPNPVVILLPGVGMFTFARNKNTARLASEYFLNAIHVMRGAEALSAYTALPHAEAFRIEYWQLEEAKLRRMPPPKPLEGRVALVTGSAGGIGRAIAEKFLQEGACVVLNDIHPERLEATYEEFRHRYGQDAVGQVVLDVTDSSSISDAMKYTMRAFGGVDLLVNNAGLSISRSIEEHTAEEWDLLFDVMVKGQFMVSRAAVQVMRQQGFGGDIINIVSKNATVAGPNNTGYGSAKAAQAHFTRLLATELGADKIRVNMVNPDAVIEGSNIWSGGWAEGRAQAYGITPEELPAFYARRTLLHETILPVDVANACFAWVSGLLNKSTGNAINVDGGVATGFLR
jgi:rhamnulose-1-phosphate aldolase/alcohol dehydrogenase